MQSFYIENKNVGNKAESEDWRGTRPRCSPFTALVDTNHTGQFAVTTL